MPSWNSRGLRGSTLEELINLTNTKYRENKLALIQKVPTPIKPIKIDQENRHITLAYFEQKSTVDYIGVVQGIPICFDAKECGVESFPIQNIHEHQIQFMTEFEAQKGIAFILIYFSGKDVFYYLRFNKLLEFWNRAQNGGRKSFLYQELDPHYQISVNNGVFVHYLEMINMDLQEREE
ncbi:Holliday junction resolvase RecU [Anaeromicropila populeti]|uniref:Holliday junction resolvase RecU n=1 Tax=Anaeromicropila populeti TaxID=37658 RepID=A0A1I6KYQ5_9FIRM|nr:Holliday junction resolvase RecU [Anaeromicropila populeti]SFR96128.1 recombination protein U [Anaeromicropila populeti]